MTISPAPMTIPGRCGQSTSHRHKETLTKFCVECLLDLHADNAIQFMSDCVEITERSNHRSPREAMNNLRRSLEDERGEEFETVDELISAIKFHCGIDKANRKGGYTKTKSRGLVRRSGNV
jgi:hypothetical protein